MFLTDRLTLDGIRKTQDGYLVASVRAARTGVQLYSGDEIGRPDLKTVRVYRPEEEVFSKDALRSYAYRPVTVNHPPEHVTADNWHDYARGQTGGEVARDGEYVRVPLVVMDAKAIKSIEDGNREVSMAYECTLEFSDGVAPDGEAYDAIQHRQRMNHLAIVSAARGGSNLRIGDDEGELPMADQVTKLRTVLVDGLSVETTDAGAQAIDKLTKAVDGAKGETVAVQKQLADAQAAHKTALETKDGEIVALKKQLDDAKITPEKIDAAVTARAKVITDAKRIAGDKLATDGKTDAEIKRAAVVAKLGDEAVKPMSDAAVDGAFIAFTPKAGEGGGNGQLRDALSTMQPAGDADKAASDAYAKMMADMQAAGRPKIAA